MLWKELLERNVRWAESRRAEDPEFFARVAREHRPRALYIGCSDARVPINLLTATDAGELFVHRNIANQVQATDASVSAALHYAIHVLGVEDVIVCGHHGCGGVRAALGGQAPHAVEAWISTLRLLARVHHRHLGELADEGARTNRLVELNVAEQVANLARHPSVRDAWASGRALRLHGWVYHLATGRLESKVLIDGEDRVAFDGLDGAEAVLGAQAK